MALRSTWCVRFFEVGSTEYLSRVWLIDPGEAEVKVVEKRGDEPWNGEFYVSFGDDENRHWCDARQHGYVAAGGGSWYSTLSINSSQMTAFGSMYRDEDTWELAELMEKQLQSPASR